ncbi:hypothetical protein Peur_031028 [Populus x canadensis]
MKHSTLALALLHLLWFFPLFARHWFPKTVKTIVMKVTSVSFLLPSCPVRFPLFVPFSVAPLLFSCSRSLCLLRLFFSSFSPSVLPLFLFALFYLLLMPSFPPCYGSPFLLVFPQFFPSFSSPVSVSFASPPLFFPFFSGFYKARERGNQGEPRSSMRPTICSYRSPAETVLSDEEGGAFDSETAPFTTGNGNFHFGP